MTRPWRVRGRVCRRSAWDRSPDPAPAVRRKRGAPWPPWPRPRHGTAQARGTGTSGGRWAGCTCVRAPAELPSETLTHTPFNGPFPGLPRYQKGKTNLVFTEARDSEWQWHQLGHMQVCTSLQTDNHASTPPLSFYRPDALPAAQPTASKHWRYRNPNNIHIFQVNTSAKNGPCAIQEAQLSTSDRAMCLVSSNLANYYATVQKLLIRQGLTKTDGMKLEV